MADTTESRLAALRITLPSPPAPAAHYVPALRTRSQPSIPGPIPSPPAGLAPVAPLRAPYGAGDGQPAARLRALPLLPHAHALL